MFIVQRPSYCVRLAGSWTTLVCFVSSDRIAGFPHGNVTGPGLTFTPPDETSNIDQNASVLKSIPSIARHCMTLHDIACDYKFHA